jgi:3-hydroxyacyl-CoA dehydrogenase
MKEVIGSLGSAMVDAGVRKVGTGHGPKVVSRAQVESFFLSHDATRCYSIQAVASSLGAPRKNVSMHLQRMLKQGLLSRKGKRGSFRYRKEPHFTNITPRKKMGVRAFPPSTIPKVALRKHVSLEDQIGDLLVLARMLVVRSQEVETEYKELKVKLESIL